MRVLVAGATGMVGGAAATMLVGAGRRVRALVRPTSSEEKRARLEAAALEVVEGDLTDPGSLEAACQGVDAVISTVSAMPFSWGEGNTIGEVDREGQINLMEAAKKASVKRFVLVSFLHQPGIDFPLDDAKMAAEEHLRSSGIEYTILQANFFMEIWLSPAFGFDYKESTAAVFGDGSNDISWVSFRDVARTCADAVVNKAAKNGTFPVGGPDALSALEVVREFERVSGTSWKVDLVPVEALESQAGQATDEVQQSVTGLQISYARGNWAMDGSQYLVQDGLTSIAAYARDSVTT